MKRRKYLKDALVLSAGGLVSKLLGAVYRIPLTALLGSGGMGVYQMVFPLYCMLLTVSAAGIPTGIARMISSGECTFAERPAFRMFGMAGLVGWLVMSALAVPLSVAQGEPAVASCCRLLAPSVFFVSVLAVVRGYFQGTGNMFPTAATEVAEQLVKVVAGIALCKLFRGDEQSSVAAAVFAVTLSEAVSAAYGVALYMRAPKRRAPLYFNAAGVRRAVLGYTVPLTFSAMAMPLGQLIESIVVVALLRGGAADATALWGIYSGCAVTLVNLPVSLSYGLAAAGVPAISPLARRGDIKGAKSLAARSLAFTLAASLPCAVAVFAFAPLVADIIFSSLSGPERALLASLVRIMSVSCVTASLVQTSSACLAALGRPAAAAANQWLSVAVRVALSAAFVSSGMSVRGTAAAANICYLVAVLLNLWYIIGARKEGAKAGLLCPFRACRRRCGTHHDQRSVL